ncbi:Histidine kinase-, DNA gyrase B-, and HSP90-like ATPase [Pricia antarctica]|uniref:histidine kinase n=1 Tax=Pricia antarctica TaxID=641691 RepID=A0A1G6W074_9FLAO|nr:ATP-binding protein [Pricia antarctica]SDD59208.1 Histidine kinase-, DNA gyrase B-, and HSP90-like ATPase [Pricia antarctica]
MVSRHIYWQLIFRILLISAAAMGSGFLFFDEQYVLSVLVFGFLVLQTVFLIRYVNQTNRKIAYFFDAIKNEDFTLRFPEKLSVKSLEELNHSLNMLNAMIQDIHLKKQAQEQYYQEILKQADIGILTINPKGHILYANPTVEKLLNYRPLNHIKQLNQVDEKLYGLFENLEPFESKTFQLTNEREKIQLALKSTSINLEKESLLLVVVQDIRRELDEKETDSYVKLIRVLTHEIMNTITPITSISESILKYFKKDGQLLTPDEFAEHHMKSTIKGLEVIKGQGNDLMGFVQSYRTFLSVPEPEKALIAAQNLLEKIKLLMGGDSDWEQIDIEVIVDPGDLELFIDEKQITQVLLNLGKNAQQSLRHQENSAAPDKASSDESEKKGQIKFLAGIDPKGKKIVKVWDNGPGIPQEHLDEIFVPFFTTKNTGTGIGLSLSKQIMRLHGGSIEAASKENTVFTLTFD